MLGACSEDVNCIISSVKANGWSCSFKQWQPRWFGCNYLSNAWRLWRRAATANILSGVHHHVERLRFTVTQPTRKQIYVQEYDDLTASNRRPSTSFSRNTPGVDIFNILPRFLENLLESRNVICSASGRATPFSLRSILSRHIFQGTWPRRFRRGKEEWCCSSDPFLCLGMLGLSDRNSALPLDPFLCLDIISLVCQSFDALPELSWVEFIWRKLRISKTRKKL